MLGIWLAGRSRASRLGRCSTALRVALGTGRALEELRTLRGSCTKKSAGDQFDRARDLLAPLFGWFTEGFDMRS